MKSLPSESPSVYGDGKRVRVIGSLWDATVIPAESMSSTFKVYVSDTSLYPPVALAVCVSTMSAAIRITAFSLGSLSMSSSTVTSTVCAVVPVARREGQRSRLDTCRSCIGVDGDA